MTKQEAAMAYASWGWQVLPVVPNGKLPATQHGVNDATDNLEQIEKWWAENPNFNIGVAAGKKSDIVVFDIDPRNGGELSWEQFVDEYGEPPRDSAMQLTAGGGFHFIGKYHPDIRSCKMMQGVDLLSDGRYFVAYPSDIEGRTYEWEMSSDPFDGVGPFDVSDKWLQHLSGLRKTSDKLKTKDQLISGNRNNGLTALGGAMRNYGMTEQEVYAALYTVNENRCEIPLPDSELRQIVKSVCRYDPDSDVAAASGLGSEAAEAILASAKAQDTDEYFFTRATSFLSQPAPLKWVVKGWIPDGGVTMVYGDSGSGKTFFTLDIACHIASGTNWHGKKTQSGIVVYMCGEGVYGMRQRIASWAKKHGVTQLDKLLMSNKAIDMDKPNQAVKIIDAVREITEEDVACVIVDTLNNHMAGDENSAKDTRNMVQAAQMVSRALNAGVIYNHHIGVSVDAKNRARGSSAWRASLDSQIMVKKDEKSGSISIKCTKMKDTVEPEPLAGELEPVPLGWKDEDGDEMIGAVLTINENATVDNANKNDGGKAGEDIRKFENAWFYSGAQVESGCPYVGKFDLVDYLMDQEGLAERTAKQYTKPGNKNRLIYNLLNAEIIVAFGDGWLVKNDTVSSQFMIKKGSN